MNDKAFLAHTQVGDTVVYADFLGSLRTVKVAHVEADVKNGKAGFDGIVYSGPEDGTDVWGYASQVSRIVKADGSTFVLISGKLVQTI